eukprot:scaffold2061_cov246-Pinguiococcus_pyrenoidosus.AAC.12
MTSTSHDSPNPRLQSGLFSRFGAWQGCFGAWQGLAVKADVGALLRLLSVLCAPAALRFRAGMRNRPRRRFAVGGAVRQVRGVGFAPPMTPSDLRRGYSSDLRFDLLAFSSAVADPFLSVVARPCKVGFFSVKLFAPSSPATAAPASGYFAQGVLSSVGG